MNYCCHPNDYVELSKCGQLLEMFSLNEDYLKPKNIGVVINFPVVALF